MPRPYVPFPDHYILQANFTNPTGPSPTSWRSSMTIYQTGGHPLPADPIVTAAIAYWRGNLRTDCQLESVELRNWAYGPQPFGAGIPIWTYVLLDAGQKTAAYGAQGNFAVGKEVACYIKFNNPGPKPGKQFLRQMLDGGDIAAVPGYAWQFLVPPAPAPNVTQAKFQNLLASSFLDNYFGPANPGLRVVHFSPKHYNPADPSTNPFASEITSCQMVGPTVNKATRKSAK